MAFRIRHNCLTILYLWDTVTEYLTPIKCPAAAQALSNLTSSYHAHTKVQASVPTLWERPVLLSWLQDLPICHLFKVRQSVLTEIRLISCRHHSFNSIYMATIHTIYRPPFLLNSSPNNFVLLLASSVLEPRCLHHLVHVFIVCLPPP